MPPYINTKPFEAAADSPEMQAKVEAVQSGISVLEDEFLANIVMPDGKTVGQHTRPMIEAAYQNGNITPLLPDYTKAG